MQRDLTFINFKLVNMLFQQETLKWKFCLQKYNFCSSADLFAKLYKTQSGFPLEIQSRPKRKIIISPSEIFTTFNQNKHKQNSLDLL